MWSRLSNGDFNVRAFKNTNQERLGCKFDFRNSKMLCTNHSKNVRQKYEIFNTVSVLVINFVSSSFSPQWSLIWFYLWKCRNLCPFWGYVLVEFDIYYEYSAEEYHLGRWVLFLFKKNKSTENFMFSLRKKEVVLVVMSSVSVVINGLLTGA